MIVKVFSDWCSSEQIYKNMLTAWDIPYGYYKNLEFTMGDDYTHAVIFNCPMPDLKIPKENVVGFTQEPRPFMPYSALFIEWAIKHVGTYFVDDNKYLPPTFKSGHMFIPPRVCWGAKNNIINKPNMMSIIGSEKKMLEGHRLRHYLAKRILETDLDIHIYGRQMKQYNDPLGRVRGSFTLMEPYVSYKYVIAVENFRNDYYYSEKFSLCIENNCIPLYFGANKIKEWYGDCCVILPTDPDVAIEIVKDIMENDPYDFNYDAKDKLYEELYFPQFLINYFNNQAKATF